MTKAEIVRNAQRQAEAEQDAEGEKEIYAHVAVIARLQKQIENTSDRVLLDCLERNLTAERKALKDLTFVPFKVRL